MEITIKNCNNVNTGQIAVKENALNIFMPSTEQARLRLPRQL